MTASRLPEPLEIDRGVTFRQPFLLLEREPVGRPVTAVKRGMPTDVTVPAHGVPDNWPAWLEMTGCSGVNRPRSGPPFYTNVVDADTLRFANVNSTGDPGGPVSGTLIYQPPRDLSDIQAVEFELYATETGELIASIAGSVTAPGTVELLISAEDTESLAWTRARFRMLITEANGDVAPQLLGDLLVVRRL